MNSAWIFLSVLAAERVVELVISRRNEVRMKMLGAREYGQTFTRVLITFHVLWFCSFVVEAMIRKASLLVPSAVLVFAFIFLQACRYWCILSLGQHWNTKVIVIPGEKLVHAGPYRFVKHPNYAVVLTELFVYPALFGCCATSLVFGFLNIFVLKKRIRQEEAALGAMASTF
jgi:methyltransferase